MNQHIRNSMAVLTMAFAMMSHADAAEDEIIVTAHRIGTMLERTTADATVIDAEDIEKSGAETVADVLRRYAGIDVAASGGPGKATSVFLRGANSGHTLVLVDGVRMGSATTGSFDWANLPVGSIERIEIVRGPQSGLYGSDAIGGVVQIFTKKGGKPEARVLLEAGGLGSSRAYAAVSGGKDDVRYALTAEAYRTRGVSVAANGTEPDSFHANNWSASLELPVGAGVARLSGLSTDGTTGLDGLDPITFAFGDVLNFRQRLQQRALRAELEYPLLDAWTMLVRVARSEDVLKTTDPAIAFNNTNIRTRIDQWSWENRLEFDGWNALLGLEQHRDAGKNQEQRIDKRIDQTAAFAELGMHHGMFDANANVRHDRNSSVQNKTTYRLGVAAHPVDGLKLFANYGTGFKAPSINDLYWPATAWSAGNPNLKPESSKGWDAGVRWASEHDWGDLELSATYFRQDIQGLIAWIQTAPFFWQPSNVNRARISGWELQARYVLGHGYLRANWTVQDAKDVQTHTWLARRAKEKGGIGIGADGGIWGADAYLAIVGPRFSLPNNAEPMAGYRKLDARAWFDASDHLRLIARVENAGNKVYEEVSGYGVMPRVWYLGIEGRY